ncbi:hypothetical protein ROZALSC1DRAFT_29208 [Rozella allomycis CSF55]|uniref:Uncharacterized protein n=1 Tax=Rozella allomycis (strain CSF55) TaxID=988480 RepID=A0A4P9YKZ3_ROZAC|nr:hypothetical protein ROZALSC1DRAFT_29208 [Rozella allomycis CSF55]
MPLETFADLSDLPSTDETSIINNLNDRLKNHDIYTSIGTSTLISINPCLQTDLYTDEKTQLYAQSIEKSFEKPPHIFRTAGQALHDMIATGRNQTIITMGETGSGKTEAAKLITNQILTTVPAASKKEAKLRQRIIKSNIVLETMGNARTFLNPNASRFGKFVELQFDTQGRLVGAQTLEYLLEKTRVSNCPKGERNFHVFYVFLAGLSMQEKQEFRLTEKKFEYLDATSFDADDEMFFKDFKSALKSSGLNSKYQKQILQCIAAILHLGNIEFYNEENGKNQEDARIRNRDVLEYSATLLGVTPEALESVLITRTRLIKKQLCTVFLNAEHAKVAVATLCKMIYSLLFSWIVEFINGKISSKSFSNVIGIADFPGFESTNVNRFEQLCINYADERLKNFFNHFAFDSEIQCYVEDNINISFPKYVDNSNCLLLFSNKNNGLFSILDEETLRKTKGKDISVLESYNKSHADNPYFATPESNKRSFSIKHYAGVVTYDVSKFVERNKDTISADITESHPKDEKVIVNAQQPKLPIRQPSVLKKKKEEVKEKVEDRVVEGQTVVSQFSVAIDQLLEAQVNNNILFVICMKPNARLEPNAFENNYVTKQMYNYGINDLVCLKKNGYSLITTFEDFVNDFANVFRAYSLDLGVEPKSLCGQLMSLINMENESKIGLKYLYLTRVSHKEVMKIDYEERFKNGMTFEQRNEREINEDAGSDRSFDTEITQFTDYNRPLDVEAGIPAVKEEKKEVEEKKKKLSKVRRRWLFFTSFCTWWIPNRLIRACGMKNPDVMQAWKEKVALCTIILCMSVTLFLYILGLPNWLCPPQNVINYEEFSKLAKDPTQPPIALLRGGIYDLTNFVGDHVDGVTVMNAMRGMDVTPMFMNNLYCPDLQSNVNKTDCVVGGKNYCHDLSASEIDRMKRAKVNILGFAASSISGVNKDLFIYVKNRIDKTKYNVYNITNLVAAKISMGNCLVSPWGVDKTDCFSRYDSGNDLNCLEDYVVGVLDTRGSVSCMAARVIMIGSTALVAAIMAFKFISALQFGMKPEPEELDKFVILQVPCYTEGEESLRKTLDSLAVLRYDDKRKPTPRIVLDILGVDPSIDPEPLSFISIGEGSKQHNMGKVYSGLYECAGHRVPFIVIIKTGKPSERSRPGNRGKRDSQMILMKFLNKIHYDTPMTPLELEIYYQIKNVIGVDPSYYEYCLMVDADTEVKPDSLTRMVSNMIHDTKIMGICGETQIANEKDSWVTMIQVYEYYISHYIAKAFESLFGTVTCLPGCFCMYRIKTAHKQQALIASNQIIAEYSENNVDTLHKKNLLSLGEDRYLTTLMLKYFPDYKTRFIGDAQCMTVVPDKWSVLLSQRRRWINSTIHNMFELMFLSQLCGFCMFSMRFVVFIDLLATLIMPATFGYLVYLIYDSVSNQTVPVESLYLIAAIYGMQVIIFILKLQWQHIGWLIINILAMPVFSFFVPLYSYWHFDDFSWGNTRLVLGERGKVLHVGDNEHFDPSSIPTMRWQDFDNQAHPNQYDNTQQQYQQPSDYYRPVTAASQFKPQSSHITPLQRVYSSEQFHRSASNTSFNGFEKSSSTNNLLKQQLDNLPSDDDIVNEIRNIIATSNLMNITKKQVRDQLALFFGVDMNPKREFINQAIELILQGRL